MRKYNFDEYYKQNSAKFALKRAQFSSVKTYRKKPRPEEEWEVFYVLTKERMKKWIKKGMFKSTGIRKYSIYL
ncbi:MAG: hypothetical protein M1501_04145 [Candidatus Omnitrophica bacterium]|nr:hypothetical protein [Candidatus Omnitrophota bacterium]